MEAVPKLPENLRHRLAAIEPSVDSGSGVTIRYYPCRVQTPSGETLDRVFVTDAEPYKRFWGIWPWDDRGKRYLPLTEIADLEESPYRLPPALASALYRAGESGMGYYSFTMIMRDGRQIPCVTGDAVDFPCLPPGTTFRDVLDVRPDIRANTSPARMPAPSYYWSLYQPGGQID